MKKVIFFIMTAVLCAGSYGCSRLVTADTYALPGLTALDFEQGTTFYLPGNTNVPNPIFDKSVKGKIEAALVQNGFRVLQEGQAQYILDYEYEMSGHEEFRTRGTALDPWPRRYYFQGGAGYAWAPMYFSTGITESYPVYVFKLRLRVKDPLNVRQGQKNQVVWVGETWTESQKPDFRSTIDYLILAAMRFFGRDTQKTENISIGKDDEQLKALKTIPAEGGIPVSS